MADGERLFLFMNAKKDIAPPVKPVPLGEKGALAVEFKNVSFRYPFMDEDHKNSRSDNVLNDISFSIAPGERIAVVGVTDQEKRRLSSCSAAFMN